MLKSALKVSNLSCEQLSSDLDIQWHLCEYRVVTNLLGVPWGGVNFLHGYPFVAVLCISNQNSSGTTLVFWLLLSSAAQSPAFLSLHPQNTRSKEAGDGQEVGRGHNRHS